MNERDLAATDAALAEAATASERVFDGRLLKVDRVTVTLPNGRTSTREMIRHPGASAMVVLDSQNRVVLERQWRAPMNRAFWEIPAGKIDAGEDPFDTARRELTEETGLAAKSWVKLGVIHNAIGYSDERIYIYLAQDIDESGSQKLDDNEFLTLVRVPFEEALAMTCDGRITDVKSVIGLMWAQRFVEGGQKALPQAEILSK
ncbi:MAG: NUDIX hydrolase [Sutterellaceae bacterium]|nr:NUDIX hydrolase [Sutterellaceae bacterium]